jgi:hypothetical protein
MEVNSTPRKFNSNFRNKIVLKISKLTNKKDFVNIFNIIQGEVGDEVSVNRNGIFINTDYGYNSYVSINSFQKYSGSGGWEDFTAAFTSSLLA